MHDTINYTEIANKIKSMDTRLPDTVTVGVRLPGDVAQALDVIAAQKGANKSIMLRQAIREWLERQAMAA